MAIANQCDRFCFNHSQSLVNFKCLLELDMESFSFRNAPLDLLSVTITGDRLLYQLEKRMQQMNCRVGDRHKRFPSVKEVQSVQCPPY